MAILADGHAAVSNAAAREERKNLARGAAGSCLVRAKVTEEAHPDRERLIYCQAHLRRCCGPVAGTIADTFRTSPRISSHPIMTGRPSCRLTRQCDARGCSAS
jgi:hypothetical protein